MPTIPHHRTTDGSLAAPPEPTAYSQAEQLPGGTIPTFGPVHREMEKMTVARSRTEMK
jgi:hypothetical protein